MILMSRKFLMILVAIIAMIAMFEVVIDVALVREQNEKIDSLQDTIRDLNRRITMLEHEGEIVYSDTGFNYLAIGNSITVHGVCDYWWDEIGMAATKKENDYVHLIEAHLNKKYDDVWMYSTNYSVWEMQGTDRAETFTMIDPYLSSKLDLITIQLGENVTDTATFQADYEELIRYIQGKAPEAQIIVVDDFWNKKEKSDIRENAAKNCNVQFADLSEIQGKKDYQCGIGTKVYDSNGGEHIVEHDGVARHPGDKGMRYIADAVIKVLG